MAVFTLPPEMMVFLKNIEYITEHAVDPDKMKFTGPTEELGIIYIDRWGTYPFPKIFPNMDR
ncbi:MAG: hypothetical protein R2771_13200 [Saprospiraceae bacterium]